MPYDPQKHHRRSIRLKGYDYGSPGAYFVTICTQGRECLLDDPAVTGIITDVWHVLPGWFPTIALDEFVVMPNHVHFILWIHPPDGAGARRAGASPAPTDAEPDVDVGATLAVAPNADVETRGVGVVATPAVARNADVEMGGDGVGATLAVAQNTEWIIPEPTTVNPNPTLGDVVGAFKSLVFTVYLDWVQANDPTRQAKFWQRNYYEHVIRNEQELWAIRRYICQNPDNWALDRDNPDNIRHLSPPETVEDYVREALAGGENGME